jgi:hypothetical protein
MAVLFSFFLVFDGREMGLFEFKKMKKKEGAKMNEKR